MPIKLTKHDIGAEVISILTKGMYPDPRDAFREYIQNSVDANAKKIIIKVRENNAVIQDDGLGMDEDILKKAIRIGISDKNPNAKVGFRGIGIYSSFHLCDQLDIYTNNGKGGNPYKLSFNFKDMRIILEKEENLRLSGKLTGDTQTDLQSILEQNISLSKLNIGEFNSKGTRVEILGVEDNFLKQLTEFEDMSDYLRDVVPLHFDKEKFQYAEEIENEINTICIKNKATFNVIDLELQVNDRVQQLFKPYTNEEFELSKPQKPLFKEIKNRDIFFGVAWGCMNSSRRKIHNKLLRGFIVKKQGFAIGKRENISKYFGRNTYFDRYIGEIIVVNKELLPNSSRNDFEFSAERTYFYEILSEVGNYFNDKANIFQEYTKSDESLDYALSKIKEIDIEKEQKYESTQALIDYILILREIISEIEGRIERNCIRTTRRKDALEVVKISKNIEKQIQNYIDKKEKPKSRKQEIAKQEQLFDDIAKINKIKLKIDSDENENQYPKTLKEIVVNLELANDKLFKFLDVVDEKFIQSIANNKKDYFKILIDLQKDFEDEFDGN